MTTTKQTLKRDVKNYTQILYVASKEQWQISGNKTMIGERERKRERERRSKNPKSSNRRRHSNEFANETTRFRMRFGCCCCCRCQCCFFGIANFNQLWFMQCCLVRLLYVWCVFVCFVISYEYIVIFSPDILTRTSPRNMHTHVHVLCVLAFLFSRFELRQHVAYWVAAREWSGNLQ